MPTLGTQLVIEERDRQIQSEGWTAEHDMQHEPGLLAVAGACYAVNKQTATLKICGVDMKAEFNVHMKVEGSRMNRDAFPFQPQYDKREKHDIKRSLIIAAALIIAELDRIIQEELCQHSQ